MASIERTAYPRFNRTPTLQNLHTLYTPTTEEVDFARGATRLENLQLSLLILLKSFQRLGYFPKLSEVPTVIITHIRDCLHLESQIVPGYDEPRTLYRHFQVIREYLRVSAWGRTARRVAINAVAEAAETMDNPADLINVALETLIKERFELPAFSTLDRLVRRVRTVINQRYFQTTLARLNLDEAAQLDKLLSTETSPSAYHRLKQVPKSPTLRHLQEWLTQLEWLESLGTIGHLLANLPPLKLKHFAVEAKALDAAELKDFTLPKRYTLLLCLIHRMRVHCRDQLVLMFIKRMNKIQQHGRDEMEELRLHYQERTAQLVSLLAQVVHTSENSGSDEQAGHQIRQLLIERGPAPQLLAECETAVAYSTDHYQPLLWRYYRNNRSTLFRLIKQLKLSSTSQDQSLMNAINYLLQHEDRRSDWLPDEVDLSFASERWLRTIYHTHEGQLLLNRRHVEVCVFTYLAAELKSGDVSVTGSEEYADYREQLLSQEDCAKQIADYCRKVDLPPTAEEFVTSLRQRLATTALQVDASYPENQQLLIEADGQLHLKKLPTTDPHDSVEELEAALYQRLPERHILDVLANVSHYTHWTRHFGPLSGSDPKIDYALERYILTAFTYGCNLGPAQAARHLRGMATAHMLSFINRRHVTAQKLNAAIVDIINAYSNFSLPRVWGAGTAAAADGTKYDLYDQNLLAEYHIRYGGWGGIAYHHVADSYVALFSHFIPCGTWEAIYIIEGLLKNISEIQPKIVHADTQGQSTPVFALAYLLGIQLMPRIRNWKDLVFYRPDKETKYQHIDSLFTEVIDWKLIQTHWPDLLQVALSIRAGKISSVTLLRKLGHESRKNRLYQAFRELGRVLRTLFLLRYLSTPELPKQITAMTNKVESYNRFARWLFFGGEGIIAENDPEEQEKIIKYNDLVANAVIFQNVVDVSRILRELIAEGYPLTPEELAALSPYLTLHLKRFGEYFVDLSAPPLPLTEAERNLPF
ncbi:Tn3 family transposase [Candidatus Acetothermia bacterium]|nr:Tn3 family transposase [Candidatus Acetothermia bacterium]